MKIFEFTAADVRGWRRLVQAVEGLRRQVGSYGEGRPAALAELKRATHHAGKCRYPAYDVLNTKRLMEWWKLCATYAGAPEARAGLHAPLFRGVDTVKSILDMADHPPKPPAQAVARRLPYADN